MTYGGLRYDESAWERSVSNGRIPSSKLAEVEAWPVPFDADLGGPARGHPEAAAAMGVMLRQAWEIGYGITIAYSYRNITTQKRKWDAYRRGTGNLAAVPGTSNHGWGVAFDMRWETSSAYSWMRANADDYGFAFDVPGESWHVRFHEGQWDGRDDMTKDEKAQLKAASDWNAGDLAFREAYARRGKDPGPPPDNWVPARKQGWGSARFSVRWGASEKHTHQEGKTGPGGTDGHQHTEGKTGSAIEPS